MELILSFPPIALHADASRKFQIGWHVSVNSLAAYYYQCVSAKKPQTISFKRDPLAVLALMFQMEGQTQSPVTPENRSPWYFPIKKAIFFLNDYIM